MELRHLRYFVAIGEEENYRRAAQRLHVAQTAGFEPAKIGGIEQSSRLEVGGDLHDLVLGPAQARSLMGGA